VNVSLISGFCGFCGFCGFSVPVFCLHRVWLQLPCSSNPDIQTPRSLSGRNSRRYSRPLFGLVRPIIRMRSRWATRERATKQHVEGDSGSERALV